MNKFLVYPIKVPFKERPFLLNVTRKTNFTLNIAKIQIKTFRYQWPDNLLLMIKYSGKHDDTCITQSTKVLAESPVITHI